MNIMFATVMERIREIGIRMAIGAKKKDVLIQFLTEAILISLIGGVLGVFLGVGIAGTIEKITDIQTKVTYVSVLVAFIVSVSVGVIFGYAPAKKAAKKDPVESLRHE
jgi:putative ABC transport system permease protein